MGWQERLISVYLEVCHLWRTELWIYSQRTTKYANLSFSDEEIITIFLFGILEKRRNLTEIYHHTTDYLPDWFPDLPSYTAFVQRLNRLSGAFAPLATILINKLEPPDSVYLHRVMDSMPIIMAQGGRRFNAKVALDLADNCGYCSTKNLYYHGVKLHTVAIRQNGSLPIPEYVGLTKAGMSDRKAYEQLLPSLHEMNIFADKAYQRENDSILHEGQVTIHTPVKKKKGQKYLDAADKILSSRISSIRQPIESFFNWLEEKTSIQMASKVRSSSGLLAHVFGRLSAAMFALVYGF